MARVYADLIKTGAINPKTGNPYSMTDVPHKLKEAVDALLRGDMNG